MVSLSAPDCLSDEFRREGFAVARGLFLPWEVEEIRERFEQIQREGGRGHDDGIRDSMDPLYSWPRIVHPHRFDALARRYLLHPKIRVCLVGLFGEEPVATQSMYYFKPPGARGQAMHQDNMYLLVQPGSCVAAWTAIDATDRENGCMMLVPKTQDCIMLCQEKADGAASFTGGVTRVPKGLKAVEVPMAPGDTLFFNGSVIHGSGPNRSKGRFRRSFIGHYAAGSLEKISRFYLPLVRMDGTDVNVEASGGGGACGDSWEGGVH